MTAAQPQSQPESLRTTPQSPFPADLHRAGLGLKGAQIAQKRKEIVSEPTTMKKTIYKYPLEIEDRQTLRLPKGAEILSVQNQREELCLWALIDHESVSNLQDRTFEIFGTARLIHQDMGIDRKYLGTVQMQGGGLVWHVFELLY